MTDNTQAELKTLIIKQLGSPLRPEDRADVIIRAIQAQKAEWEREARIDELEGLERHVSNPHQKDDLYYFDMGYRAKERQTELKQELEQL